LRRNSQGKGGNSEGVAGGQVHFCLYRMTK
jgi:hypothetical protein